jgi:hypothetical protein
MIVNVSLKQGGKLVFTGNVLKVYSIGDEKGKKLAIETVDKVTSFKFTDIKKIEIEKEV